MAQVERYRPRSRRSLVGLATVPISVVIALSSRLARGASEPPPDTGRHRRLISTVPDPVPRVTPTPPKGHSVVDLPAGYYRVAEGDSVSSIALAHSQSTAALLARNGLGWRTPIFPGQIIRLAALPSPPTDTSSTQS
jgi:LysM repeat protein